MTGGWVVEDYYHFRGKKYAESTIALEQFPVDASGRLDVRFQVPEDYGGVHEVDRAHRRRAGRPERHQRSRRRSS